MKKITVNLLLIIISINVLVAQNEKRPEWTYKLPKSETGNYKYYLGNGTGKTLKEAKKEAITAALYTLSLESNFTIEGESQSKITNKTSNDNVKSTIDFTATVKTTGEKIQVKGLRIEEIYNAQSNGQYEYWILLRKAKNESVPADFDIKQGYGSMPIIKSVFVPGWGQLHKQERNKGWSILGGEAILISGVLISQLQYTDNHNKAYSTLDQYKRDDFLQKRDTWGTIRNVTAIAAAGLYVYNMIDVFTSKGAPRWASNANYKFYPVYANNTVQLGVSFRLANFKFN